MAYEVQKVLSLVDWASNAEGDAAHIGIVGWGEGGLIGLYAAALDPRIDAACVSGYFGPRENIWREPIDRNVFGLLEQFGDAELAAMIAPRPLIVEALRGTDGDHTRRSRHPQCSRSRRADASATRSPGSRACPFRFFASSQLSPNLELVVSGNGQGAYGHRRGRSPLC